MTGKDIYQAELRNVARILQIKANRAHHKAGYKDDPFAMFHFAQALAFEESIEALKHIFQDEMKEEDWE